MAEAEIHRAHCDELPVAWIEPPNPTATPTLALWLTHLGGSKEQTFPVLERLAAAGCVALSFDPWRHGERGTEQPYDLASRVFGGFRRQMWPILGQTTLDCLRVLDWALTGSSALAPGSAVVAGGVSMGGDISVALAGVDPRVSRVAAVVATPDWTRPGMRDIARPEVVLDQGDADTYAQWFYDRLDPLTHLDGYRHGPAVTFECGSLDTHVPADGATRFRDALLARHPAAGQRVRVNLHDGASHLDAGNDSDLVRDAVDWLLADG